MHLNYLKSSPPPLQSMEKLSSMKLVPGAKMVGDHWHQELCRDLEDQHMSPRQGSTEGFLEEVTFDLSLEGRVDFLGLHHFPELP